MVVHLSDELAWIEECYPIDDELGHKHVSVYVLGDEQLVLVDSGSFLHRTAIAVQIESLAADATIAALVLSHSDYPHAANVRPFVEQGVELVASSGSPAQQGLPDATKCDIGGEMTIAGRRMSFIDPPLADRSHTTWIFDHGTKTLFTADGFGSRHQPGSCTATSRDLESGIPPAAIESFHRHELPWLRYVDPERLRMALAAILDEYEPAWIAPCHGHPIAAEHVRDYLTALINGAEAIATERELSE